jgi:hypothetical protein
MGETLGISVNMWERKEREKDRKERMKALEEWNREKKQVSMNNYLKNDLWRVLNTDGRVACRVYFLGRHSPNVSKILLRFFYDFSTIIPCAHLPSFPRKILVSRSKENPSPNLACTKFFYNFSTKSP